ncbi:MAG TPA: hypothetical protein PLF35_11840, partial [Prolixibacteraceae bacterium]|nr:hypothetical protein [Prolixibacteraceae bacterium]
MFISNSTILIGLLCPGLKAIYRSKLNNKVVHQKLELPLLLQNNIGQKNGVQDFFPTHRFV